MSLEVSIKKRCGAFTLNVNFAMDNNIMGVLGASGCGKSMTLKCIAGIETPDSGKIVLNKRTLFDSEKRINLSPQKRKIGYLFQNYALFPHMNIRENISMGIKQKEKTDIINRYLDLFQLKSLEYLYPKNLSGGQQQRVALARIFASEPDILMLDEPFSALDDFLKWQLELELSKVLKSYNKDILFVSHNRDEIYRFCDDIVVLSEGNIVSHSTKYDLFKNPQTLEASKLSGCKNHSEIERMDSRKIYAKDWNLSLTLNQDIPDNIKFIGIRAHEIVIAKKKEENTFSFKIEEIIENIFTIVLMVRNQNARLPIRIEIAKEQWQSEKKLGEDILIRIDDEKLLFLK